MDTIIKKAIEGGYSKEKTIGANTYIWMDPLFWTALGKSCGWSKYDNSRNLYEARVHWQYVALKFFDTNLNEGWDSAIAYLQSIIN